MRLSETGSSPAGSSSFPADCDPASSAGRAASAGTPEGAGGGAGCCAGPAAIATNSTGTRSVIRVQRLDDEIGIQLSLGTLEPWNFGTLEPWNFGTLELWNLGT